MNFLHQILQVLGLSFYQDAQKKELRILKEIHKAQIFNSTIVDSEWLKFKSFSPGEWAADYGLLYTLYRVLSGMRPQNILEFGLGQTSKMIHQYANYFHTQAITCEHDEKWIKFFKNSINGNYKINIQMMELVDIEYKGEKTLSYRNIKEFSKNKKFDFILVDGPYGQDHFSRPQILDLLTDNIFPDNFCIILDDYEREGEKETGKEILQRLANQKIMYHQRVYSAEKDHLLICSNNLKFLTSI